MTAGAKVTKREVVFAGNYLRVIKKYLETGGGEKYVWETAERTNIGGRGAVVVVALTKSGEVILERNWRVPLESGSRLRDSRCIRLPFRASAQFDRTRD